MPWLQLLCLPLAWVTMATNEVPCGPSKYEWRGQCCDLCPAGRYVSRHCDMNRNTTCSPCTPGTFTAHPNEKTVCLLCSDCREDQEMVTDCTQDRDRQCQCRTGSYYCDSADCTESCHRCTRCEGPTLQTCNATRDAVCATDSNPHPGKAAQYPADKYWPVPTNVIYLIIAVSVIFLIVTASIGALEIVKCCRRRGVTLSQLRACLLKRKWRASGSHSLGSSQPNGTLSPTDPESGPTAPGIETTPFLQEECPAVVPRDSTGPGPWEKPGEGTELQAVGVKGRQAAPEPVLQTPPAAQGPQGHNEAAASLPHLEEEYKETYFLKDTSQNATNRLYYEFGRNVPENKWKMLMRFVGLEENDIEICEHKNPGNLREQRHQMLLRWNNRLGTDASPFRLMAAMRKLKLRVCLQNIINTLVAENILGRRAETPS